MCILNQAQSGSERRTPSVTVSLAGTSFTASVNLAQLASIFPHQPVVASAPWPIRSRDLQTTTQQQLLQAPSRTSCLGRCPAMLRWGTSSERAPC